MSRLHAVPLSRRSALVLTVASVAGLGELVTSRLDLNVEYVEDRGPAAIAMRVHERGSGETRSCGTGACAAAVAVVGQGAGDGPGRWRVDVPGGELEVSRDDAGHVFLTGPALIVARGTTDL